MRILPSLKREIRRSTPLGSASRVTVLDGKVKNNVKITTITYVGDLVCVGADALHRPAGLVDKNGWRQFMGRTIHPAVLLGEATGRCGHRPLRETGGMWNLVQGLCPCAISAEKLCSSSAFWNRRANRAGAVSLGTLMGQNSKK